MEYQVEGDYIEIRLIKLIEIAADYTRKVRMKSKQSSELKEEIREKESRERKDVNSSAIALEEMSVVVEELKNTLSHFKSDREPLPAEILRLREEVQKLGIDPVKNALIGARFEQKFEGFDPAEHFHLKRVFDEEKVSRFINLGIQEENRKVARQNQEELSKASSLRQEEWEKSDPASREIKRKALEAMGKRWHLSGNLLNSMPKEENGELGGET